MKEELKTTMPHHIPRPNYKLDRHYTDDRLAELYDLENLLGPDAAFYTQLANEFGADAVCDLGCGTGLITVEFASPGRRVIGVDPAEAMLDRAKKRDRAEQVEWILGDSRKVRSLEVDLVTMTGNVAQVFLDDALWQATLEDLFRGLRPGGHLAFESRNPNDRAWERWTPQSTRAKLESSLGPVETWLQVVDLGPDRVTFEGHNLFLGSGEDLVARSVLRFRSKAEIVEPLDAAGFEAEDVFGGWDRQPFTKESRLMVFIARRP